MFWPLLPCLKHILWGIFLQELGVSIGPRDPFNLLDPPKTDQHKLEPTNPTVGGGSPSTKPNTFGSVSGFTPQKPEPPDPTIKSTKFGDIQSFLDKNLQILVIFLLFRWRAAWNPPNSARSHQDLVRFPAKYWLDLNQSGKISTLAAKPKTNRHKPETQRTRTKQFDHHYGSVSVLFFSHPKNSSRVGSGYDRNPTCGHP